MQTTYFETTNFIRHRGNVVDLGTYRQKLAAVSGENWPAEAEEVCYAPATQLYVLEPAEPQPRRRKGHKAAPLLDMGASLAVIVMTLTAVVQFVRFF